MPAGIQPGVDATRGLQHLEEDVHVAARPEALHVEEGESIHCIFQASSTSLLRT